MLQHLDLNDHVLELVHIHYCEHLVQTGGTPCSACGCTPSAVSLPLPTVLSYVALSSTVKAPNLLNAGSAISSYMSTLSTPEAFVCSGKICALD